MSRRVSPSDSEFQSVLDSGAYNTAFLRQLLSSLPASVRFFVVKAFLWCPSDIWVAKMNSQSYNMFKH